MRYSIIIADDHPFTAKGMEAVIASIPELHVVGKAFNGIDAISLIKREPVSYTHLTLPTKA